MIEVKRNNGNAIYYKSIFVIDETDLNNFSNLTIPWNNQIILFWLVENNTNVNFTAIDLTDNVNEHIIHTVQTNAGCYSVSFAGTQSGAPTDHTSVNNLNNIIILWSFGGLATGNLRLTIYSIPL